MRICQISMRFLLLGNFSDDGGSIDSADADGAGVDGCADGVDGCADGADDIGFGWLTNNLFD